MKYIKEVCPHCDEVVTATAYEGIIKCPYCGKYMVLCSMCEEITCTYCKLKDIVRKLNESN